MKKTLLYNLFLLASFLNGLAAAGQAESHNFITYDTTFTPGYAGIVHRIRISRPIDMFSGNLDTASRPVIITIPGQGEMGANFSKLRSYGPHYWLDNGWDGGVQLSNGRHFPILITVISSNTYMSGREAHDVINHLLNTYRIKRNSVHVAGLSQGAFALSSLILYESIAGNESGMKLVKSLTCLEGASAIDVGSPAQSWSRGPAAWGIWAQKYGGKFFGVEGINDVRNVSVISNAMNPLIPGSAYFTYTNIGGGGHCCWNSMYDPNRTNWKSVGNPLGPNIVIGPNPNTMGTYKVGENIFTWMLRQGDSSLVGSTTVISSNAGADKSIILPINFTTVSGSATTPLNSNITSYSWTLISGPNSPIIATPNSLSTNITGLIAGSYVLRLTVVNNLGETAYDDVLITVASAANLVPIVNAGIDQTINLPLSTVNLTGAASDPDGSLVSYSWTKQNGTGGLIQNSNSLSTVVSGLSSGTYTFRLTVTDNNGASVSDDVNVNVVSSASNRTVKKVAITEYKVGFLANDGLLYSLYPGNNQMMPFNSTAGKKIIEVAAGFNILSYIDEDGFAWHTVLGSLNPFRIQQDTTGAPFNNNTKIYSYFFSFTSIRADGSIWYWGNDDGNYGNYNLFSGTNNITRPIQISPVGLKFKKLVMGSRIVALAENGDVYEWVKGGGILPVKKIIPRPAVDVFASHYNYAGCIIPDLTGDQTMGYPYVWGTSAWGWGGSVSYTQPTSVKNLWGVTVPIKSIATNHTTTHYIDSLGRMFGIGDNAQGEIGNGQELVNKSDTYTFAYGWSWGQAEYPTGAPAIEIGQGIKWKSVHGDNTYSFYKYAFDQNDSLYSWGRGKAHVLGNGIRSNEEATYSNNLDVLVPTMVSPLTSKALNYNFFKYTINPGADQSITGTTTLLAGSGTPTKHIASTLPAINGKDSIIYSFVSYLWSQESGPNTAIISNPTSLQTSVNGLIPGSYTFKLLITDNHNGNISGRVKVTVSSGPSPNQAPIAAAGSDISITLPVNTATLNGSGTDADGSISSYSWTKVSGPAAGTIGSPNTAQTNLSGLTAGVYVYRLTVTDNGGLSSSDDVQVTVNNAPAPSPNQAPTAAAGSDIAITLPVNTATLNGSGTDADGTISSYSWTKVSGPAAGTIGSLNTAQTNLSGLTAGVYVYRLTVTDNGGLSSSDDVQVTVNNAPPPPVSNNQAPVIIVADTIEVRLPIISTELDGSSSHDPDGSITSYIWKIISGPNNPKLLNPSESKTIVTDLQAGIYIVSLKITDNAGAERSKTAVIKVVNSLYGISLTKAKIFPNPVIDNLNIVIDSDIKGIVKVRIIDLNGRVVILKKFEKINFNQRFVLDLSKLSLGSYVVWIQEDLNTPVIHKIIH